MRRQLAIRSAILLGAERVIAIDRFPERLHMAREKAGATDLPDYQHVDLLDRLKELTGGQGPDACIDAVGMEAHLPGMAGAYDKLKQMTMLETDWPWALRQAIMACRNGGIVSVIGIYGGFIENFSMGVVVNRGLTIRSGQTPVQRYMKPLLEQAPDGYSKFLHKEDECTKVVLKPGATYTVQ
ncbi:MAG: zinc-binding dehydrogenase [Bryobacteraceae bacterium]|nr:zinc-binding dehydrogenase [Bryobacteraceae bacterium]